jgi:hypothetical protein
MSNIYEFLIHIPWWVYLILVYCIFIGVKSLKTSIIHIRKLFIIPLVFGYLSLHTLLSSFNLDSFVIFIYIISVLVGIGLGVLLLKLSKITVDAKHKLIKVPGSWVTLFLILIIFACKYFVGHEIATDPQMLSNKPFEIFLLVVSGVTSGIFIGRLIYGVFKMIKGPFENLSDKR